jgi:hypothetical protein
MAALTNTTGPNDFVIQYSTDDGSSYTDITDFVAGFVPNSWPRQSGEGYTHGSDEAYVKKGKLAPTTFTINAFYTDGETTDHFEAVRTQHATAGGGQFMVKVGYGGSSSGDESQTTNTDAFIDDFTPPASEAESPGPHVFSYVVKTSGWDYSTW